MCLRGSLTSRQSRGATSLLALLLFCGDVSNNISYNRQSNMHFVYIFFIFSIFIKFLGMFFSFRCCFCCCCMYVFITVRGFRICLMCKKRKKHHVFLKMFFGRPTVFDQLDGSVAVFTGNTIRFHRRHQRR